VDVLNNLFRHSMNLLEVIREYLAELARRG
jgi:hypothetical protein